MKHEWNEHVAEALDVWLEGHNHRRVERMTGFSRSQIYDWQLGRYPFPVYAVPRIFMAIPEVPALSRVLALSDVGLQLSRVPQARTADDVRDSALRVAADAGELARIVAEATKDGVIDDRERRQLELAAEQVQRVAEELRQAARSTAPKNSK